MFLINFPYVPDDFPLYVPDGSNIYLSDVANAVISHNRLYNSSIDRATGMCGGVCLVAHGLNVNLTIAHKCVSWSRSSDLWVMTTVACRP